MARYYYRQDPKLLRWALTNPLDRAQYTRLTPLKPDFDYIRDMMLQTGILDRSIEFSEYVDTTFAEGARFKTAWKYEPGANSAE